MMREIKFRAWHMIEEWMDSAWLIDWEHGKVCHSKHNQSDLEDCISMQYTGLKDKNGTEIYEGDIVEEPDYSGGIVIYGGSQPIKRFVVEYETSGKIGKVAGFNLRGGLKNGLYKGEVIGNIWEDGDLIDRKRSETYSNR